jgi:ATP-binding cassette subfamily F protein uup
MPLITLDNISLNFSEKLILNEVSTTILKGDKIALIGRNGEGKSTFMRVLAGAIEPDDGKVPFMLKALRQILLLMPNKNGVIAL